MLKQNKGSLTVEASLSLIIFIFAFLSILYLGRFAKAQIVLQHALNQTAKEISQYSYISNKLGIQNDKTSSNRTIEETDKIIGEIVNLIDVLNADKTSIENIDDKVTTVIDGTQVYLNDPKALLGGFIAIAKDEMTDFAVSKYVAAPMSRLLIKKYLPAGGYAADIYLKKLGVDNGLDGLNFDTSTIFKDGKTINITMIYTMSLNLPLFPKRTLCFRLNSSTIGWESKLFYDDVDEGAQDDVDKSVLNIWDYGGEKTTDEFIKIIKNERNLAVVRTPLSLDYYDSINNTYTYVHSMNTELKSYVTDGVLNIPQIKSTIKSYAKDAIKDTKRVDKITMEDGIIYDSSSMQDNQSIKVIIVIQESSCSSANILNETMEKIKKELKCDNLEIEIYYSDGLIEVEN